MCTSCGIAIHVVADETKDFSNRDRYNKPGRHHYSTSEHYSQVVSDFTGTSSRDVPVEVMNYCRTALGRGPHVTSSGVYEILRTNGYRAYYQYKYEIASRLRGQPEFHVTSGEVRDLRAAYKRYANEFLPYQQRHNIGKISARGRRRLFWPLRFILARMCEEIGRPDLIQYIRGVASKQRLATYDHHWQALKQYVDQSRPAAEYSRLFR